MFKKHVYTLYGCKTIGGRKGHHLCIQFVGKCVPGWNEYYNQHPFNGKPWKQWFTNPIFCNRSKYEIGLKRYRVWFWLLWHSIQW